MTDKENTIQTQVLPQKSEVNSIDENQEISIDFYKIIRTFLKFWWVCVIAAVLCGSVMLCKEVSEYVPKYKSSATFTVSLQSSQAIQGASTYQFYYQQSTANQMADTFPYLLDTEILESAIKRALGREYYSAKLTMTYVENTNMFTISSVSEDAQEAYDTLLAAIKAYPEVAKYIIGNIKIDIITEPQIPTEPTNKKDFLRSTAIGMAIGFVLAFAWICVYAIFRSTIRDEEDVKEELRLDVMGFVPLIGFKKYKQEIDERILITNPLVSGNYNEEIKVVRNTIENKMKGRKVLMLTSTAPGEGKTTLAINVAVSFAGAGKKVLLIDGDLRNQSIGQILDIERGKNEGCYIKKTGDDYGIDVMLFNVKDGDIWKYMQVERLTGIVNMVKEQYDIVIIDTPPCGLISDATTIAQVCDSAAYVVLQDTVRISRIKSSLENLMSTDVEIIGCILNGTNTGIGSAYSYGYGRYGNYYSGYRYSYGRYGYGYGYGKYGKNRYGKYGSYGKYGKSRYGSGYSKYGSNYGKYGSSYGKYGYGDKSNDYGYGNTELDSEEFNYLEETES